MANTFLMAERDRWPIWLAVALGTGAAGYFALPIEPPVAVGWAALVLGLGAAAVRIRWHLPLGLAAALLLGFGLAKLREDRVATPVLDHALVAHLTGRIVSLEPREQGVRVVLDEVRSGALPQPPRRIRVALRAGGAPTSEQKLRPGQWLSLTARLDTPPSPSEPGASDFGRRLYFQGIGAIGFAYGRARTIVPGRTPDAWERLAFKAEALRLDMTRRIQAGLPGSTGGIASALVTGARGTISEEDDAALRDAGLAHALSISGLHMALVGGGIFWLLRAVLAAVPAIVLRYPVKKWAAVMALAAAAFYLVISGVEAAAVRSFVMLATMMTAVLLDRPALTMRSLALAAILLLCLRPESVADPGFQMSFAAVAALIAVAERDQMRERAAPHGIAHRYLRGIVLTSLVASLATTPFTLFHFGRAAHYAVLGNLIVMPIIGFWIMPLAALAVMLMPLGLEGRVLPLLGEGIEIMVRLGAWVSGLPGAVSLAPAMPLSALVLMSLGGLWLAIWRTRWRWWGLAPIVAGVALAFAAPSPDMLVASDGATVALRGADGRLQFLRKPRDKYAARDWLRRDGDVRDIADAVGVPGLECDGLGCVVPGKDLVAASLKPEALLEDCARAQVMVSAASGACAGPAVVIDGAAAQDGQGWRVTLKPYPSAVSVRSYRGARPWVVRY